MRLSLSVYALTFFQDKRTVLTIVNHSVPPDSYFKFNSMNDIIDRYNGLCDVINTFVESADGL